jgi:ssDNA thymidine ADP-ribosyltransferase, DarT
LEIKSARRSIRVPLAPHGCVADYVPFYFAPRSPMLYKLHKGSVPNYTGGQDPLVYLVSSAEAIAAADVPFVFSDGNCAATVTCFNSELAKIESVVDWEVMRAQMWRNTADDPDRRRRRMAEFLAYQRVPIDCFSEIVVRRDMMRRRVEGLLESTGLGLTVTTRVNWYF